MEIELDTIKMFGMSSVSLRETMLLHYKRNHGASFEAMQAQVDSGERCYRISTIQRGSAYEIFLDCVDELGVGPRLASITTKSGVSH